MLTSQYFRHRALLTEITVAARRYWRYICESVRVQIALRTSRALTERAKLLLQFRARSNDSLHCQPLPDREALFEGGYRYPQPLELPRRAGKWCSLFTGLLTALNSNAFCTASINYNFRSEILTFITSPSGGSDDSAAEDTPPGMNVNAGRSRISRSHLPSRDETKMGERRQGATEAKGSRRSSHSCDRQKRSSHVLCARVAKRLAKRLRDLGENKMFPRPKPGRLNSTASGARRQQTAPEKLEFK